MNKILSFFILILVCSCSDRKEHIANILSMNSIDIKTNRINKDEVIARGAFPFEMIDSLFFLFTGTLLAKRKWFWRMYHSWIYRTLQ